MAYIEDDETGKAPPLNSGESLSFTVTLVDGVLIPDAMNEHGEPVIKVTRSKPDTNGH